MLSVALSSCAGQAPASAPKPVTARTFPSGSGVVYTHSAGNVFYGEPRELTTIRSHLAFLCEVSHGSRISGLPPSKTNEIIQVDMYALAEGSCKDTSLHVVLIERNGSWLVDACGTKLDVRALKLDEIMEHLCAFPSADVDRILLVRQLTTPTLSLVRDRARLTRAVQSLDSGCAAAPRSDVLCR